MSNLTPNLNLFKYDVSMDANVPFSITEALNNNWDIIDEKCTGGGLELCDIGMALYVDETKGLRRYLNGQIVDINENTQAFLDRLLQIQATNPDNFATEDEWQAEALLNIDSCVYKFVLNYADDGETVISVRLPKYPDYVEINAGGTLPVIGNGSTLGLLPNATIQSDINQLTNSPNAILYITGQPNPGNGVGVITDPSKSGIQTTLKQTKLKLRYFIQIATGSETENNIINDIELNNPFSLLDYKYSEYELNNLSWLRSNGQYNSKAVYPAVYDLLLKIYNGTEAKAGVSVKLWTDESATDYDFRINTTDESFRLPLKTKLASGKAVVGNGMTLGVTDNNVNYGLGADSSAYVKPMISAYGTNAGTSSSSSSNINKTIGITTDPTKSGMELSDSGLYLYYYVGETVQNANLIDAGRIGEQLSNCLTRNNKEEIVSWGMPDYDAGITKTTNTLYTAEVSGFIWVYNFSNGGGNIEINGTKYVYQSGNGNGIYVGTSVFLPISKDDTYKVDTASRFIFYPLKGAK